MSKPSDSQTADPLRKPHPARVTVVMRVAVAVREVSSAAFRTVGEPGFALHGDGYSNPLTSDAIRRFQSPPLTWLQAIASGARNNCRGHRVSLEACSRATPRPAKPWSDNA